MILHGGNVVSTSGKDIRFVRTACVSGQNRSRTLETPSRRVSQQFSAPEALSSAGLGKNPS